jgi:hypothetical protein
MNLYFNYGRRFFPIRLKNEPRTNGRCSIGGVPPAGVTPVRVEPLTQYFATLGLEEGLDVSLFTTFDYKSPESVFNFFRGTYKLHDESISLVQFVVHKQTGVRNQGSELKSDLPILFFAFGSEGNDPECSTVEGLGNPAIYVDHKVGGQPYFGQLEGEVGVALSLLYNGYVHLLQLVFPSNKDAVVNVDWPFGEAVFHVFAKKMSGRFQFRYIWA